MSIAGALDPLAEALLEAMSERAAIVDGTGRLLAANRGWREHEMPPEQAGLTLGPGDDVIERFRAAPGVAAESVPTCRAIADGLSAVLRGELPRVSVELPHGFSGSEWDRIDIVSLTVPPGGALFSVTNISERVQAEHALAHYATHDGLTGLANRALLLDRVEQALYRPDRAQVAVLLLDLDRFKLVNASLGPLVGDRLLALAGQRLQAALEPGESVARAGDDSFVVVSEVSGDAKGITDLTARLLDALAAPFVIDGHEVLVTASMGVALAATGVHRPEDLLRDADVAVTEAKLHGGGHVAVAHPRSREASVHRLEIEQALRRALDRHEFWLEYQPEVSLETGLVVGAEALLRWEHPTLGSLSPSEFIGIAEATGLIISIGDWVLHEACHQAATWALPEEFHEGLYVAVNVSAHQLADENLAARVSQALLEAGLMPSRLCIEVTESAVLERWEVAQTTLRRLRRMGVRVALDDFGTGYSTFGYLLRLPADIVKLDSSFVARLVNDQQDRAIVEAVVTLARRLGMQVVAEGVEDERQRAVLAGIGCHIVQGFDLGRPGDAAALLGLVWQRAADAAS